MQGLRERRINILEGKDKAKYRGLARAERAVHGLAHAGGVETLFSRDSNYRTRQDVGQDGNILPREISGQNEQRFCSAEPRGKIECHFLNEGPPHFAVYVVRSGNR